MSDGDCRIGVVAAVAVEHQQPLRTDRFADRFRRRRDGADDGRVAQRPRRERDAEFEGVVSGGERLLRPVVDHRRLQRAAGPAVDVDADLLPVRSAEEPVNRHAEALTEDVPEGEFDSGHRGAFDDAAAPELLPGHHLREIFDPGRILADQQLFEVAEQTDDGLRITAERRLAESGDPFVGVDPDEDVVLVGEPAGAGRRGSDHQRFDPGDFHADSSLFQACLFLQNSPKSGLKL